MTRRILEPNTILYPVPVVLITTGGDRPNVMTLPSSGQACNRIASCSAEPPRLSISVRPGRYTHTLIQETGEFVVNLPTPEQQPLTDYLGVVTGRKEDANPIRRRMGLAIAIAGLRLAPALKVNTPLLADCPVNVECTVEWAIDLNSHTLFIGRVQAVHVEEGLLNENGEVDLAQARGLVYGSSLVRERPTYRFQVEDLRRAVSQTGQAG